MSTEACSVRPRSLLLAFRGTASVSSLRKVELICGFCYGGMHHAALAMCSSTQELNGIEALEVALMHLKLVSSEGSDLDDKTWVYIIEVLDVRILLEYERVATLLDDRLKRLSFSDHVYLVAGPVVHRLIPPNRRAGLVRITAVRNEQENQEQRAVP
ncbi:hypothetical protein OPV22_012384 [Ensete ventricosum]|uniref:Uncharacterized protein n=1 Tax=Ensete ventricosum TaxID=4639 RepID=A0AAV8R4T9_ENSVE|nr:hypothetical protein OPV22_012384 [Ensete ventricosum]